MASFGKHFEVDSKLGKSNSAAVKQGTFYRITILTERLIRLEYSKTGIFNDNLTDLVANRNFPVPKFTLEEDDKYLVINTKYFALQYLKEMPFKGPSFAPDTNLKIKLLNTDKEWYYEHPEARNFNSNAFSLDDFKGGNVKLSKGLYSTDGFVSITDNNPLCITDVGVLTNTESENVDIYLFMYRRDFGLCLKDYFALTGSPLLLPRYALGIWWYRDRIYSDNDIHKLYDVFKKYDIPLSVLLLGEFWHIKDKNDINLYKTGYTFNKDLFPEPKKTIDFLHENNIKLGLNLDPSEGVRKEEDGYKDMQNDFKNMSNGVIPFNAFDKMFIINYFEFLINPLMKLDVDFFWMDYRKSSITLRALNYYHIKDFYQNEYKRPLLLTRNTGIAAHRNGVLYSGETVVSWDTLRYLPFYNSQASNAGVSWWAHDVGGFKEGTEDAELYMRYAQFACFSPIFKFGAKRGIYYKREPWLWDFKTYNIVKEYCKLRYQLIPYLYSESYVYYKTCMPLVEPLYYSYPELYDEPTYKNEYFFGTQLFVSPITSQKDLVMDRAVQRVFLPKGIWYELKSGKKYIGDKRYVTFYKDEDYPVFAKAGSIIPMANEKDFNFSGNPSNLDIMVFPGKTNRYSLYEDDGNTRLYENGYYIINAIEYNYNENNCTLSIKPLEGKTAIIPDFRNYRIIFRNMRKPDTVIVTVQNEKWTDCSFENLGTDYVVTINNVDTTKEMLVTCNGSKLEITSEQIINEDINSIINDLMIPTNIKEELNRIVFSDMELKNKRIEIKKLTRKGLMPKFVKMFMKLYDYLAEI